MFLRLRRNVTSGKFNSWAVARVDIPTSIATTARKITSESFFQFFFDIFESFWTKKNRNHWNKAKEKKITMRFVWHSIHWNKKKVRRFAPSKVPLSAPSAKRKSRSTNRNVYLYAKVLDINCLKHPPLIETNKWKIENVEIL